MYDVSEEDHNDLPELYDMLDVRAMNPKEVSSLFPGFKSGFVTTTYIAEPSLLLPFLMNKFESKVNNCKSRRRN